MRLYEFTDKWVRRIIDTMILTVIDPSLPGARKNDCYAHCAYAIRGGDVPDDAEFIIYGKGLYPAHGLIAHDGQVICDAFAHGRVHFNYKNVSYNIDKFNMNLEPLEVVYKIKVGQFKELVKEKYKQIVDAIDVK